MDYKQQYKHPEWQKKRLEILERDNFKCTFCGSDENTLHVHHLIYINGNKVWEYDNEHLITYCEEHHKLWHKLHDSIKKITSLELLPLMKLWDFLTSVPLDNTKEMYKIYKTTWEPTDKNNN